jgi:aminomethyltransferase
MEQTTDNLRKTPFNAAHRTLGGRMVPFCGWDMPVQFKGLIDEHMAVRTAAGLFDVSHMGEIIVSGADAQDLLQRVTSNNVAKLEPGRIHYTGLLYPNGTFVDDLLIYCYSNTHYFVVANAANVDKDFAFMRQHMRGSVTVENHSDKWAQLALQGPKAETILQKLTKVNLAEIKYYWFTEGNVAGVDGIISRTGYTGEDGFEFYMPPANAEKVLYAMLEEGAPFGVQPTGLGCRDTLRLEAKMALYGNDIDDAHTILEADLGWILKLNKGVEFNGMAVLQKQKEEGITRKLVGFEMVDKGIARHGYPVYVDGREVGPVTSGSFAPFLKKNIGLAYLPIAATAVGTEFEIDIRGKRQKAVVVETPFYKRQK